MTVPNSREDLLVFGELVRRDTHPVEVCSNRLFLPIIKDPDNERIGRVFHGPDEFPPVTYMPYHISQPNGGRLQPCVQVDNEDN